MHGYLGGLPPVVDLARERLLADVLITASRDGLLDSAHDLSEGGLAQALVECLPARRRRRPDRAARRTADPFVALFSESAGRAVVSVPRSDGGAVHRLCAERGLPAPRIGVDRPAGAEP